MSVIIKINTIDRTSLIDWNSVNFQQVITSQIDTLNFSLKKHATKTFKPDLLDDIEMFEGATKVFGGKIVDIEETVEASQLEKIRIMCKDHAHEMDSRLVIRTFTDKTINEIIDEIKTDFLPAGFTTTQVDAPITIGFVAFNYEQPSKVFQQLAELVAFDWFVDPDKDIFFKAKFVETAPFNLNDTDGKYFFNTLRIKKSVENLRNTIFVRGGEFDGALFAEVQEADGEKDTFDYGFRYANAKVFLDTGTGFVQKTLGIDNITDPTTVDFLYNFQEKAIKVGSITRPAAGDKVKLEGNPKIPIIIQSKDNVSINEFGTFEHKVVDKSIESKAGARDRAKQELLQWANDIEEGSFETIESGLRVGQKINIQSTIRSINTDYIISRISTVMKSPTEFRHKITLVTTQTFGMIEFLQKLLISKDKEIEINPDEVLDKIEAAFETITVVEEITQQSAIQISETATIGETLASTLFTPPYQWANGVPLPQKLRWNLGSWA